jgi:hypothetical protein
MENVGEKETAPWPLPRVVEGDAASDESYYDLVQLHSHFGSVSPVEFETNAPS